MKLIFATVAIIISLFGAPLGAAESAPVTASAEQQFQQADVQLAIEQYKKLRMAAFDIMPGDNSPRCSIRDTDFLSRREEDTIQTVAFCRPL